MRFLQQQNEVNRLSHSSKILYMNSFIIFLQSLLFLSITVCNDTISTAKINSNFQQVLKSLTMLQEPNNDIKMFKNYGNE